MPGLKRKKQEHVCGPDCAEHGPRAHSEVDSPKKKLRPAWLQGFVQTALKRRMKKDYTSIIEDKVMRDQPLANYNKENGEVVFAIKSAEGNWTAFGYDVKSGAGRIDVSGELDRFTGEPAIAVVTESKVQDAQKKKRSSIPGNATKLLNEAPGLNRTGCVEEEKVKAVHAHMNAAMFGGDEKSDNILLATSSANQCHLLYEEILRNEVLNGHEFEVKRTPIYSRRDHKKKNYRLATELMVEIQKIGTRKSVTLIFNQLSMQTLSAHHYRTANQLIRDALGISARRDISLSFFAVTPEQRSSVSRVNPGELSGAALPLGQSQKANLPAGRLGF